jgi:His-Xaa-Ser system protein HxsD
MDKSDFVLVNLEIYPLNAVYGAAYIFLDKAYIFLEDGGRSKVKVNIKPKKGLKNEAETLKEDFLNELVNFSLRDKISHDNRQIREYIMATSLASAFVLAKKKNNKENEAKDFFDEDFVVPWGEDFNGGKKDKKSKAFKDPEGICIPWEEKHKKKLKRKK